MAVTFYVDYYFYFLTVLSKATCRLSVLLEQGYTISKYRGFTGEVRHGLWRKQRAKKTGVRGGRTRTPVEANVDPGTERKEFSHFESCMRSRCAVTDTMMSRYTQAFGYPYRP